MPGDGGDVRAFDPGGELAAAAVSVAVATTSAAAAAPVPLQPFASS